MNTIIHNTAVYHEQESRKNKSLKLTLKHYFVRLIFLDRERQRENSSQFLFLPPPTTAPFPASSLPFNHTTTTNDNIVHLLHFLSPIGSPSNSSVLFPLSPTRSLVLTIRSKLWLFLGLIALDVPSQITFCSSCRRRLATLCSPLCP